MTGARLNSCFGKKKKKKTIKIRTKYKIFRVNGPTVLVLIVEKKKI